MIRDVLAVLDAALAPDADDVVENKVVGAGAERGVGRAADRAQRVAELPKRSM